MKAIVTPEQMRVCDSETIKVCGVPSQVLMENAASASAAIVKKRVKLGSRIVIFCGVGNNGGDGFALARHLHEFYDVRVLWFGESKKMSAETATNFESCKRWGIVLHEITKTTIDEVDFAADCCIDAMIGVGGSNELRGLVVQVLERISEQDYSCCIALDVPTGLDSLTGKAHEYCFAADVTLAMNNAKVGYYCSDGIEYCGEIEIASVGLHPRVVEKYSSVFLVEESDIQVLNIKRSRKSSKFDYGKVALFCGSEKYPGAGALCANAAIKSGAGLVELFTPIAHSALLPEVIPTRWHVHKFSSKMKKELASTLKSVDAIAIGSGLEQSNELTQFVAWIVKEFALTKKIILDGGAITQELNSIRGFGNVVCTPHAGEFARMVSKQRSEIEESHFEFAKSTARTINSIMYVKHSTPCVCDGTSTFLIANGTPALATAGSGDVLAGLMCSLFAQFGSIFSTAEIAAFAGVMHAKAGVLASNNSHDNFVTASDICHNLQFVF